jgi:hypothetical protein
MKRAILILGFFALAVPLRATTYTAANCTESAVQTQINSTVDGDPNVGSGVISCTDNTTINLNYAGSTTLNFSYGSTGIIRITGITFITTNSKALQIYGKHGVVSFRLDHCHIEMPTSGSDAIFAYNGYGLFDHNYFQDQVSAGSTQAFPLEIGGDYPSAGYLNWQDATSPGTNQAVYIEANYYTTSACGSGSTEGLYDSYYGAKVVARFNTISGCNNWGGHGTDTGYDRSSLLHEIYGNHITNSSGLSTKIMGIRGGTMKLWGNTFDGSTTVTSAYLQYFRYSQGNSGVASWGRSALSSVERMRRTRRKHGPLCNDHLAAQRGRGPGHRLQHFPRHGAGQGKRDAHQCEPCGRGRYDGGGLHLPGQQRGGGPDVLLLR